MSELAGDGHIKQKYRVRLFRRNNGNRQYVGTATVRCNTDELSIIKMAFEEAGWEAKEWGEPDAIKSVPQVSDMVKKR